MSKNIFLEELINEINNQILNEEELQNSISKLSLKFSNFYSINKEKVEKELNNFIKGNYNVENLPYFIKKNYLIIANEFNIKFHRIIRFRKKMYREGF